MRKAIPLVLFVIAVGLVVHRAQDSDFHTGKIVAVEKVASVATGGEAMLPRNKTGSATN